MKTLHVGDLHLREGEMRFTVKMQDNNEVMLKNLVKEVEEDEEIGLVVLGGDIQDKTPSDIKEVAMWRKHFRKLGQIMQRRINLSAIMFLGLDAETMQGLKDGTVLPVVACRGNHDHEKVLRNEETEYTFFDELLREGLIINPRGIAFKEGGKKHYIDIRNYGQADRALPKTVTDNREDWFVMAVFHDNVLMPESPLWLLKSKGKEGVYNAEEVMKDVDVGFLNHIHEKVDPIFIEKEDGTTGVLWQYGSMGRTSLKPENVRDVGYCALFDTNNPTEFGSVEIDVIPAQEYFSFEKAMRVKQREKDYKDFSLQMDTVERTSEDPCEVIQNLENVEDEVKAFCVEILQQVQAGSR
ncbi:hypothetical protein CN495_07405 [Bacillus thuringiensis]|uniref:Calcineurin-like phosphoesterase domain-containing protein n=1 Tax=Bacillus thuringiensis TaxID=1428 RepID=A0ABD6SCC9_BACTU|nr:metallophosphoesterase [Bacillus thuringiensis]PER55572.1 hypothetical protein CN495_07405 [Bacillus thuringiensis]